MKNNTYFTKMREAGAAYEARKREHEARKKEIVDTYGWDSPELKAWYDEKEEFPFTSGACKAYRAWRNTIDNGEEEIEMNDFLWDREVADFVETLKEAGIRSFLYTNQSTAVMENIHGLVAEGCRMEGLETIIRKTDFFGEDKEEKIPGIRFTLS